MAFRSVYLLLSVVVALTSAQLWTHSGVIHVGEPVNATIPAFNLQEPANFTLTYNPLNVIVCVAYAEFGLPHWSQYSNDNCIFYINTTGKDTETITFALLDAEYIVGTYLSEAEPKAGQNTTIKIDINGMVCANGTYYDEVSKTCLTAEPLGMFPQNITADFTAGETKIWMFQAPNRIGHIAFQTVAGGEISAENSVMYARYNAAPLAAVHDYSDATGGLLIPSPLPGTWVISVHAAEAGTAHFEFTGLACGTDRAGTNCTTPVTDAFSNASYTIHPEEWIYLRFEATANQGLLFSVTTENSSSIPYIFAAKGQVPSLISSATHESQFELAPPGKFSADIINCNRQYCDVVRSIAHNTTDGAEEWFVGIYSQFSVPVVFAFWFNTSCIPNCETDNHGQCSETGRCDCEIDYEGTDCMISKGLGPQYIVLIIIASLVVASAIIGFVAWAYMRRKRADYEIVS